MRTVTCCAWGDVLGVKCKRRGSPWTKGLSADTPPLTPHPCLLLCWVGPEDSSHREVVGLVRLPVHAYVWGTAASGARPAPGATVSAQDGRCGQAKAPQAGSCPQGGLTRLEQGGQPSGHQKPWRGQVGPLPASGKHRCSELK